MNVRVKKPHAEHQGSCGRHPCASPFLYQGHAAVRAGKVRRLKTGNGGFHKLRQKNRYGGERENGRKGEEKQASHKHPRRARAGGQLEKQQDRGADEKGAGQPDQSEKAERNDKKQRDKNAAAIFFFLPG